MYYSKGTVILVLSGEEKRGDIVINLMFTCRSEVNQDTDSGVFRSHQLPQIPKMGSIENVP